MAYGFDAPAQYNTGIDWSALPTYGSLWQAQDYARTADPSQMINYTVHDELGGGTLPAWLLNQPGVRADALSPMAMTSIFQEDPNDPSNSHYYQAMNLLDPEGGGYSQYVNPESFIRIKNDDLYKQAVASGQKSILNNRGTYDILDRSGNVIDTRTWTGLKDEDHWDSTIQALVGIALGAGAMGAAGAGATGASGAGAGATGAAGAGAGASFSPGVWGSAAIPSGAGYGLTAATPGLAAGSTFGGAAIGGGLAGAAGAAGAGAAGSGAAGSGGAGFWDQLSSGASSLFNGGSGGNMAFDWTSLIGPATSLIGGKMSADAAGDASAAQLQAAREAAALNEPFRQGGMAGMNKLLDLLGLSGNTGAEGYGSAARDFGAADFQADPGYAFRQSEGEKAIQRAASAAGRSDSGRAYKDLMRFNQGEASQEYGRAFDRFSVNRQARLNPLQSLMGAGQTAANTVADYTTQAGNAQAAGRVGSANAWNNALSQGSSTYQQNNLMNRMFPQQTQRPTYGAGGGFGGYGGSSINPYSGEYMGSLEF